MSNIINRQELIEIIKNAKNCVRVVGTVAFNLPINELKEGWLNKIKSKKNDFFLEFISESEPSLTYSSLISSDRKASGEDRIYEIGSFLNIQKEPLKNLKQYLINNNCENLEPKEDIKDAPQDYKQKLKIKTCYLPIHIPFIKVDDQYFITYTLTKFSNAEKFEEISKEHKWYSELMKYFNTYLDNENGAKKYCTEETLKGKKLEVIQMYNSKREAQGQLPRDSFLDVTKIKLVIWGFIFTRDGKVIIHRRKDNAKDNRGMWDKSVGGHVSLDDVDTVKAASRELAEELFKAENEGQGGHGQQDFLQTNENKMIYLGEWNPDIRYTIPFDDVSRLKNEYYFFRMDYSLSKKPITSSRVIPNKELTQDVKVFVDFYVCIAGQNIDTNKLANSDYETLELHELKEAYRNGVLEKPGLSEIELVEKGYSPFKVTPDLKFIIESEDLWELELTSFAEYLKSVNKK